MDRKAFDIYQLTAEREKAIWSDCLFVFDTSALLEFYNFPDETRKTIFSEIFEAQKNRLWIPNHVQFEFLKNREKVIKQPIDLNYTPLIETFLKPIADTSKTIENKLKQLKEITFKSDTHPYIDTSSITEFENQIKNYSEIIGAFDKTYKEQIEKRKKEILELQNKDTVLEQFEKYLTVGRSYSFEEIIEITKEGKHRYEFKIPPGYEDLKDKKTGTQIFGDLIIWKQVLEFAKETKRSIVFICNDLKEDWCIKDTKNNNRIKSPRFELIKEFYDHAGKEFWMYSPSQFLYTSKELLHADIEEESIKEISDFTSAQTVNDFLSGYNNHTYEEKVEIITGFSLVEIGRILKFVNVFDKAEANKLFISLYSKQIFIDKIINSTIESIGNALSNFNTIDPILTENIYNEIPHNIILEKFKKASLPKIKSAIGELKSVSEEKTREIVSNLNLTESYDLAKLNLKQISVVLTDIDLKSSLKKLQETPIEVFQEKIKKERIDEITAFLLKVHSINTSKAIQIYNQTESKLFKEKLERATIDRIGQNLSSLRKIDKSKTKNILELLELYLVSKKLDDSSFRDFCSVLNEIAPIDNNKVSKKLFLNTKLDILSKKIARASFKEFCNGIIKLNKVDAPYSRKIFNKIEIDYLAKKLDAEQPKFEELANAILNLNNIDKVTTKNIVHGSSLFLKTKQLGEDATASSEQSFLTSIFAYLELDSDLGTEILKNTSKTYIRHILTHDTIKKFKSKYSLLKKAFQNLNYKDELNILEGIK